MSLAEQVHETWVRLLVATAAKARSRRQAAGVVLPRGPVGPLFVTAAALAHAHRSIDALTAPGVLSHMRAFHARHEHNPDYPLLRLVEWTGRRSPRISWQIPDLDAALAVVDGSEPDGCAVVSHAGLWELCHETELTEEVPASTGFRDADIPEGSATALGGVPGASMEFMTPHDRDPRDNGSGSDESAGEFDDGAAAAILIAVEHLGRGTARHEALVKSLLDRLVACTPLVGKPGSDLVPDLRWDCALGPAVGEAKTCGVESISGQLRLGLGQVLEYRVVLAQRLAIDPQDVVAVLFTDFSPSGRWYQVCSGADVRLIGPDDEVGDLALPV